MYLKDSQIEYSLIVSAIYVVLGSFAVFVHWVLYGHTELVIGRNGGDDEEPERVHFHGLALPTDYYKKHNIKYDHNGLL